VYPDGSVARQSTISATGRDIPLAKVGFTMELPAAYSLGAKADAAELARVSSNETAPVLESKH
jgi:hypothetical protein